MAVSDNQHNGAIHELLDEVETLTIGFLFANPLLLCHTVDYLPVTATLNLAATCHELRRLLYQTRGVFRRLDLSTVKSAQFDIAPIDQGGLNWRNVQLDENVTEDDFYAGPLRGIFSKLRRRDVLHDVTTLILDGLSVTAELVHEIISDAGFSVRILSLRGVKNLNEPKLRAALRMAVRPSRPEGTPRLQGLYIFGPQDPSPLLASSAFGTATSGVGTEIFLPEDVTASALNATSLDTLVTELKSVVGDFAWWDRKGTTLSRPISTEWAETMLACAGIISFDAPLCQGPRHMNSPAYGSVNMTANSPPPPYESSKWAVATCALDGCAECGSAPEGLTVWGKSDGPLPLLSPVPRHSSSVKVACCPGDAVVRPSGAGATSGRKQRAFVARCLECLHGRLCWGCMKWWCEKCFTLGQMDPDGLTYKVREDLCVRCDAVFNETYGGGHIAAV